MHDSNGHNYIDEERACNSCIACIDGKMLAVTIDSMVSKTEWPYMVSWFASLLNGVKIVTFAVYMGSACPLLVYM